MVLYPAVSLVSSNPQGSHDHAARDARALAQGRLSALLALEVASTGRAAASRDGAARADPADEYREPTLGRATHSRRTAQAGVGGRAVERREGDGPAVLPPLAESDGASKEHEEDTLCPATQRLQSYVPLASIPVRIRCI